MKKRMIPVIYAALILCIVAVIILMISRLRNDEKPQKGFGMFSWNEDILAEEHSEELSECIGKADVTLIYQQFSESSFQNGTASSFVKEMQRENVEVYALMGDAKWTYENGGDRLIEHVEHVVTYNKSQDSKGKIKGVMVDVEPYLLGEWDEGEDVRKVLMQDYLNCIQRGYTYAVRNGLVFLVCIPTFYDATSPDVLERLIADACDGIAVMNYNRTDEYGQMEREVDLAREYDKKVICIYELQESGLHDLEEINTYAGEGLQKLWESADSLKQEFGYEKLQFAYHYYEPLKALLENME